MSQRKKRGHFLSEVLFLDVLFDRRMLPQAPILDFKIKFGEAQLSLQDVKC